MHVMKRIQSALQVPRIINCIESLVNVTIKLTEMVGLVILACLLVCGTWNCGLDFDQFT